MPTSREGCGIFIAFCKEHTFLGRSHIQVADSASGSLPICLHLEFGTSREHLRKL